MVSLKQYPYNADEIADLATTAEYECRLLQNKSQQLRDENFCPYHLDQLSNLLERAYIAQHDPEISPLRSMLIVDLLHRVLVDVELLDSSSDKTVVAEEIERLLDDIYIILGAPFQTHPETYELIQRTCFALGSVALSRGMGVHRTAARMLSCTT